jgi:hypothetical protein
MNKTQYIIDKQANIILETTGLFVNLYRYGQYSILYFDKKTKKIEVDLKNKKDFETLMTVLSEWLSNEVAADIGLALLTNPKVAKQIEVELDA